MLTQEKARMLIRKLKNEYGITYSAIANITGISVSQLSLFIVEKRNLKRDKLFKLENYVKTLKGAIEFDL